MIINGIDTEKNVFLIAEVGNNHEGNFDLAMELVDLASKAGADAVKFQTFKTEDYVSAKDLARFDRLKKFELTHDNFVQLAQRAKSLGLAFISTPFDLGSAEFLKSIVDAIKISSGDNNFTPLIQKVAGFGIPMIMSTGLSDETNLKKSVGLIKSVWKDRGFDPGLALLHCVSSYPVPPEDANISAIINLRKLYDLEVGYSDHTEGIEAALLSLAMGARIIEKHFTIDKNYSDFRDHKLSADFDEFKKLSEVVRKALRMLGDGQIKPQESEVQSRTSMRRSIIAKRNLKKGEVITSDVLNWVRPGGGLGPGNENDLIGKKIALDLKQGDLITLDVVN